MFVLGLVYFAYGFLGHFGDNKGLITAYIVVLRIIQGMASSTMQTTFYAVGTNDFPHRKALVVGGIEITTGIGCIIGPLLGACLIKPFGFAWSFRLIGVSITIMSLFFACVFPKSVKPIEEDNFTLL